VSTVPLDDRLRSMSFVQVEFIWFMLAVFITYWALKRRVWQNLFLVVVSAIFYGWVHPWFLILLYSSAILDFCMGQGIGRWPQYKRLFLAMSMTGNLSMLGVFKYYNFFVENFTIALSSLSVPANFTTLSILLPVGISFYTFQTMSYTIDVYRGELKPRRDFVDYLVFVSFFPQLVAGPIERAGRLLPQIEKERKFEWAKLQSGFGLAMWGAFKKLCIADAIAPYVDKVFILEEPQGPLLWAATAGFGIQILADFSGYTDIARGTARMIGFELHENFNHPFLARSTPEFWRRWHMTLSFWIRDYVLVPLLGTGTQISFFRFVGATTVAFLLIGLWHGASWNFVLVGAWNGLLMILYPMVTPKIPKKWGEYRIGHILACAFHMLVPGMIMLLLFRETSLARIGQHLMQNPFAATRDQWIAATVVAAVALAVSTPLVLAMLAENTFLPKLRKSVWYLPAQTTVWGVFIVLMFVFYRVTTRDFIYFQF
jgi:alginate O-acetyltransferase complex protein AlgI